mgnify:FL=1
MKPKPAVIINLLLLLLGVFILGCSDEEEDTQDQEIQQVGVSEVNQLKKGYWVAQVANIHDQELFTKYFEASSSLVERGDYKVICGGEVKKTLEGDPMLLGVVLEFNSLEEAKNYYDNEDYQKILKIMGEDVRKTVERNISVVEGN